MLRKRSERGEETDIMATDAVRSVAGHEQLGLAAPQPLQTSKPLRFVTNYGAPHPKRRRIGAACLTCRKRKTACSGERPTCETCKQNKLECAGYANESATTSVKRRPSDTSPPQPSDRKDDHAWLGHAPSQQQPPKQEQRIDPSLSAASYTHPVFAHPRPTATALPPLDWSTTRNYNCPSPGTIARASGAGSRPVELSTEGQAETEPLFSGPRNRMPYFRWLGPTAIMPGFKQMVVKVKRQDTDMARSSTDGGAAAAAGMVGSPSINGMLQTTATSEQRSVYATTPGTALDSENRTPLNLPFYDTSPMPPSELITHLANTFFIHLGCNYPFLQRERFLRDLEEKQVDAILVDAVCSIAARFSTHPLITQQTTDEVKVTPADYGHAFAQRAKTALLDTFSCPSVAAVQAALLLAYIEFGESRDSGLWMYLGISIRMAQDLGLHKVEGLKYRGKNGPTPKMIKRESIATSPELSTKLISGEKPRRKTDDKQEKTPREKVVNEAAETMVDARDQADEAKNVDEQKAVEQERVDTFWAVFFLDRMVSSGTGRRSTLRDKDIELSFPALETTDRTSGWPTCFPALIRIVHLYGRVADLLNSIKEPSDITTDTPKRLASMESQVTNFYQGLSPRLHFDAVNFQHYMKAGEGTNFVLLHFWFHTLIVLLHRPTLLKTFEGRMLQLFPNSQQLSMSSAKTIADILSYSQLMDAKASLGNPFTSQPIYIAACAFLKETVEQTASSTVQSRASSPSRKEKGGTEETNSASIDGTPTNRKRLSIYDLTSPSNMVDFDSMPIDARRSSSATEQQKSSDKSEGPALSAAKTANALAKHTLLATAASQHYQLCYKALQSLETYWAGTKYILTVLDQKFEGVGDPLLYTVEEGESAMERPKPEPAFTSPGWRRKLSWGPYLYNAGAQELWREKANQIPGSPGGDLAKAIGWTLTGTMNSPSTNLAWHYPSGASGATGAVQPDDNTPKIHTDVGSSTQGMQFLQHDTGQSNDVNPTDFSLLHPSNASNMTTNFSPADSSVLQSNHGSNFTYPWPLAPNLWNANSNAMQTFGDMMIESQDVEMSLLGLEMMPWFDSYPTHELSGLFGPGGGQDGSGHNANGQGQGTPQG